VEKWALLLLAAAAAAAATGENGRAELTSVAAMGLLRSRALTGRVLAIVQGFCERDSECV